MIELGAFRKEAADLLWRMCQQDFLFFVNTFCFIFEPRSGDVFTFNTWEFQDDTLRQMRDHLGLCDIGVEKSRDQGVTWMVLALFLWRLIFHRNQSFMMTSRNADLVDKSGSRDALFAKLDFMMKHLPGFLRPNYCRTFLCLDNPDMNSAVNGATSTGDAGRGGRNTAAFMDELPAFAIVDGYEVMKATQYNTKCRIFVGTPKGKTGAYFDIMHKPNGRLHKIRLHWTKHPLQGAGAYTTEGGQLKILDETYKFPSDYPFILDGKIRSPYYDEECARAVSDQDIAAELDIDYGGSDSVFFDGTQLTLYANTVCQRPMSIVRLQDFLEGQEVTLPKPAWERLNEAGAMVHLWLGRDAKRQFPRDRKYFAGADVAAGTGASNSCLKVLDGKTGRVVLELACPKIMPHEFAAVAVAICRIFTGCDERPAMLIWEANGPGRAFGTTAIELGHTYVYYRTNEQSVGKKQTDVPGWTPTTENQRALLEEYRRAMLNSQLIELSEPCIEEARQYIYCSDGGVRHSNAARNLDPSGARKNHGDRVMATALGWHLCRGGIIVKDEEQAKSHPVGSFGWRRDRWEKEEAEKKHPEYQYLKRGSYRYGRDKAYRYARVA